MEPSPIDTDKEARYLRWIAIYNLSKGILLCLLAIGLLGFLHQDLDEKVREWVRLMHFNMEGRHIVRFLAHVDHVTDQQLKEWIGITFAVSGVFIAEGVGLLLRQQWAKYLVIAATSSFVPIEIYETHRNFSWMKLAVLFVNIAIVAFLGIILAHEKKRAQQLAASTVATQPRATPISA
ncbi:MAG TPA: DUF2127 domain-containing protein [Chthoniobacter sp.]|jgi:uncharacterized membrane protein (DUF2068 family)